MPFIPLKSEITLVELPKEEWGAPVERAWEIMCTVGRRFCGIELENDGCTSIQVEQDVHGEWIVAFPWAPLVSAGLPGRSPPNSQWTDRARDLAELQSWHRITSDKLSFNREALLRLRVRARAERIPGFDPAAQTLRTVRIIEHAESLMPTA